MYDWGFGFILGVNMVKNFFNRRRLSCQSFSKSLNGVKVPAQQKIC